MGQYNGSAMGGATDGLIGRASALPYLATPLCEAEHHAGELFPRVGVIVTNLALPSRAVVQFYSKRGTAEQWIKGCKQAAKITRLSCRRGSPIGRWPSSSPSAHGLVNAVGRLIKHAAHYRLLDSALVSSS
jgi:hypothetical protein